jgi:type IV pilus assembly protein PilC
LRHSLGAGLSLVDVFRQQAKSGPVPIRAIAEQIRQDLEHGTSLDDALNRQSAAFPAIFVSLATVGERTGHLPEVFGELERYFLLQQKLRRQFVTQSIRPAFQFFAAVGIIAFLIWILGVIGDRNGVPPLDPLGLGWTGARGALWFLVSVFGLLAALLACIIIATRSSKKEAFALWLLRVPLIGPCLRALALARFCLALRMTHDSGMAFGPALALSLRATGNPAFAACVPMVQKKLEGGQELTLTLAQTGIFPADFQNVVAVAEESGQIAEVMRRQAEHYQEEAERRLTGLTKAAAFLIWLMVAVLIAVAIVRIFINVYLAPLEGL